MTTHHSTKPPRPIAWWLAAAAWLLAPALHARAPSASELMNWAERSFAQIFPAGPATQVLTPYTYRYYPQTGHYLGVAADAVYVFGPITGNTLMAVGTLPGFSCQVYPGDCGTGPLAIFEKPFAGEWPLGNFLDHDVPKEFVDANARFLTFWGESLPLPPGSMIDGHSGYDFRMPEGTPIVAAAPGTVIRADTSNTPFFCPTLGQNVSNQQTVTVQHALADGTAVASLYTHLSQVQVAVGQTVRRGQALGLSGNTGCSTNPHLHFETYRLVGSRWVTIDPYGWTGVEADPWALHPDGATSMGLWVAGSAPKLFREAVYDWATRAPAAGAFISRIVYQGIDDGNNPNNESVQISIDPRATASLPLDGYALRFDKAGLTLALPRGITLTTASPTLTVYAGSGTNQAGTAYLGQASGIVSNLRDDCVRLIGPSGSAWRFNLGNGCP